jgi:putative ABC transport system ATP-binding protein
MLVLEALDRVNRELRTTTAVITHNAAISKMADRVVYLADGKIVQVEENRAKLRPRDLDW